MVEYWGLIISSTYTIKIDFVDWNPSTPFKFSRSWLLEEDFRDLVIKSWKPYDS
jgi:hypothetical protein